ncbi:carboxypeptidase-like regulatory domain-containing protein [Tunturibacter empetritectus]|uniref:Carboxypeptidase regulatory-like domain-containing protein n=1 Tax=Tunturiibacter lichenicola TaxID=2051959 RepID=A0A7W8JAS7_9BACT|nr:carboxypeptidase-like regulatory domain-containing protein [Edaphobacter lichenicola]MBB5345870.1 hypothetical protein [Edaphobacter lichenicola]
MSANRIVCRLRRNDSILFFMVLVCALWGGEARCPAQIGGAAGVGTSIASSSTPDLVSGRVINAATDQPVRRALVRLNTRAVLTDSEGRFRFEQNKESSANILVTKPGFYATAEYGDAGNLYLQSAQLAALLELRIYPEALLTGVVLAPDGTPLPEIWVTAMRRAYDDMGRRWVPADQRQTDSHGGFRIPVPAGEYRLQTRYSPRNSAIGEAVLPVAVPSGGASNTSQLIRIHSGEEQTFELRPVVSAIHTVGVSQSPPDRGFLRISARASNGGTVQVNSMPASGDETKIQLPQGTYTLTVRTVGDTDGSELAETTVTVPDHDISGVVLRFSPVPSIPVELLIDSSSSDTSSTGLAQLGLNLQSEQADSDGGFASIGLSPRANQTFFFSAPPGSYRLVGRNSGAWYIKSASYGDSDLLEQELVVAPGASGIPIRVVVSNQTAALQGTVHLNSDPVASWVYLIPNRRSAQLVYSTRSSSTGSYSFDHLPPGSYQAIAFQRRHSVDYRDPESLTPFGDRAQAVTVNVGDKPTLNLDAVPATEVIP